VPLGGGEPGATIVFTSRRVMEFPVPALPSQAPAQISSWKVWEG
jgi:hypothetical protein